MAKPNPMGNTFAERSAAAAGKSSFTDPTPDPEDGEENSTFASRASTAKKTSSKAVASSAAENKAVSAGRTSTKKKG